MSKANELDTASEVSFSIRLTATEAEQLSALLDMAVKAGGLRVANVALQHLKKIQDGLQTAIVPASQVPSPLIRG